MKTRPLQIARDAAAAELAAWDMAVKQADGIPYADKMVAAGVADAANLRGTLNWDGATASKLDWLRTDLEFRRHNLERIIARMNEMGRA